MTTSFAPFSTTNFSSVFVPCAAIVGQHTASLA
jgi:hypothetical protein